MYVVAGVRLRCSMCATSSVAVFGLRGFALLPRSSVCSMTDVGELQVKVATTMGRITGNLIEVGAFFSYMLENKGCRENPWVVSMAAKTKAAQDDLQDLNNTLIARMSQSRRDSRNKMGAERGPGSSSQREASRSRSSSAATITGGATDGPTDCSCEGGA